MADDGARKLRVAAVQMESKNGLIKANLEHALPSVDEAVKKGAELIVLPEFMPTGYIFTNAIWDAGEPKDGLTVKAQLGNEEAGIVEDVIIDPSRKTHSKPECKGRWAGDFPWGIRIWRQVEAMGSTWYRFSSERKKKAREISSSK